MRVLDGAVAVFCAKGGVEPQSETVWHQATKYNVPRIAYVNKMDIMGADFMNVVDMLRNRLKTNPVPIQLPIGKEDDFKGIVDLIDMQAIIYIDDLGTKSERTAIPDDLKDLADEYREKLIESVAEHNDSLLEKYFEGEEIKRDELIAAIREATIDLDIVPVTCGSSYRNKGVQPLLDCIIDFMPSPLGRSSDRGGKTPKKRMRCAKQTTRLRFRRLRLRLCPTRL